MYLTHDISQYSAPSHFLKVLPLGLKHYNAVKYEGPDPWLNLMNVSKQAQYTKNSSYKAITKALRNLPKILAIRLLQRQ